MRINTDRSVYTLIWNVKFSKKANITVIITYLLTNIFTQQWIVEFGASHHIVANKNPLLSNNALVKSLKD